MSRYFVKSHRPLVRTRFGKFSAQTTEVCSILACCNYQCITSKSFLIVSLYSVLVQCICEQIENDFWKSIWKHYKIYSFYCVAVALKSILLEYCRNVYSYGKKLMKANFNLKKNVNDLLNTIYSSQQIFLNIDLN